MYECKQCHVKVRGNIKCCPLCQGELSGTAEKNVFPKIELQNSLRQRMFRVGLFITLIAVAICIGINLSRPQDGWWVLFVLAGSACFWFSVSIAMEKWYMPGIIKRVTGAGLWNMYCLFCVLVLLQAPAYLLIF